MDQADGGKRGERDRWDEGGHGRVEDSAPIESTRPSEGRASRALASGDIESLDAEAIRSLQRLAGNRAVEGALPVQRKADDSMLGSLGAMFGLEEGGSLFEGLGGLASHLLGSPGSWEPPVQEQGRPQPSPTPTFAPPYVPVGPVLEGDNIPVPAYPGFAPPYVPVGPILEGDNLPLLGEEGWT